jgi:hypothetical protein
MRPWSLALVLLATTFAPSRSRAADPPRADRAGARVAFHLARAAALRDALAPDVYGPCRTFPSPAAWERYLDGLLEEGVTFAAHLDEAWRNAKRSGDPDLGERVKAAKRRMLVGDPVRLVAKLKTCAWRNGAPLDLMGLWRRAVAEVPGRRQDVAHDADAIAPRP